MRFYVSLNKHEYFAVKFFGFIAAFILLIITSAFIAVPIANYAYKIKVKHDAEAKIETQLLPPK